MKFSNVDISKGAERKFNLKGVNFDEIEDTIIPNIPIHPRINVVKAVGAAGNIYTTPTDKRFYLQSIWISIRNAAANAGTNCYIQATISGVANTIIACQLVPSADNAAYASLTFPIPILIDSGTNIAATAANIGALFLGLNGYTEELI